MSVRWRIHEQIGDNKWAIQQRQGLLLPLTKNAINGDIARELRLAGNEDARFSGSHLREYLLSLGHSADDVDDAFGEWFPNLLTRLTEDDFGVSKHAWAAIDDLLGH